MAFFRKAGSILGRTVSTSINQEIPSAKPSIFQAIRCMSTSKIFIGGLSYSTDDASLREAFDKYGEVAEARVIVDRETGRSRGFGFVTYSSAEEASAAIQALDQQELHGRRIRVNYANDRTSGFGGGGFRGGNFGSGGGYGGGGYGGNYGRGGYGDGGYGGSSNFNPSANSYGSGGGTSAYPATEESHNSSDNYASSNRYNDGQNFGGSGEGFGDKFGGEENNSLGGADEGLGKDEPLEGDNAERRG
ncbi:Nuclear cap-binding protein complex, subunit CBP20 (RRM superfamily) [Handroanthus impetiginosus]|uniref:Nuclear cap-binding protein complex, subunit CBP20 (RRM superfamily) n=1 Tax=Handroanthus impetiginosus TaxID=429701 RepID=A0A2G9H531_9LAMI|nr:Nuclear cap-binding protein complex, subunit CBP20 (RRM superfamily) [Handroanthus impetiginosus]